jgi:PAS domain S-box-containing protein
MLNSGTQSQIELLRQLPAAVDMKDLDHKFIFWNNEAEKLYGYTTEEIIGQPVRILYDQRNVSTILRHNF